MFETLSTRELLALATFLARDISAIWTLAMAGVALLSLIARRPDWRAITGGFLVWFVALGGYASPVGASRFFDRGAIYGMLVVALALWAMVFVRLIFLVAEQRLRQVERTLRKTE
jgi:hypothetical protein